MSVFIIAGVMIVMAVMVFLAFIFWTLCRCNAQLGGLAYQEDETTATCAALRDGWARAERRRRVKRVRLWLLRRAWREVRRGRVALVCCSIWAAVAVKEIVCLVIGKGAF